MCNECEAIDRLIFKYRQAQESVHDDLAGRLLIEVIKDLELEKAALHPDAEKSVG